jgi:hypothetical protein
VDCLVVKIAMPDLSRYPHPADNEKTGTFWPVFAAEVDVATLPKQPDLLILKLIQKLSDADPVIRRNAAGALRLQGPRAAVAIPALSALLTDQDSRVRDEAERAIDHLRLVAA